MTGTAQPGKSTPPASRRGEAAPEASASSRTQGPSPQAPNPQGKQRPYEIVDFAEVPGTSCPCGTARRAFAEVPDYPATIHVTEISADAKLHYHKRLTETYYFLECDEDARIQLNDELLPVRPGMCVMIRPGTRHRAIGNMKVLIVVLPKFDPADEWFD